MKLTEGVPTLAWDVHWDRDGLGKHGRGPFPTKAQAEACLRWYRRAYGIDGQVTQVVVTRRLTKRGPGR